MEVPLQIAGGVYKHKARSLSSRLTVNFWPQIQTGTGTSQYILESFPGLKLFSATSASGLDRGMYEHRGIQYQVTGFNLESVDSSGARAYLGQILGTSRCIIEGMNDSIVIVSEGRVYQWDAAANTLTEGTDSDFQAPQAVAVLNNQAIYDGEDSLFGVSDVGTPLTINGLNYAAAEVNADQLVRPVEFGQLLYLMGEKTIETWWNSGNGNPPFDRQEGGSFQVGLAALHSVAKTDRVFYFLGDDRNIYRVAANSFENNFTPQPLLRQLQLMTVVEDAIAMCIPYQGTNLYILKFPTENKTFCYPEGGEWFELSSSLYDSSGISGRWRGNSYSRAYSKHLISDEDGNIYELDDMTYTEGGDEIIRDAFSAPIHSGAFGLPGKNIELKTVTLAMETGTGLPTGQGVDPVIMLSISRDGGKTFGAEMWAQTGRLGEYMTEVRWNGVNETGLNLVLRFRASDPVYYSLHAGMLDLDVGI